jgi:hypothetical protein
MAWESVDRLVNGWVSGRRAETDRNLSMIDPHSCNRAGRHGISPQRAAGDHAKINVPGPTERDSETTYILGTNTIEAADALRGYTYKGEDQRPRRFKFRGAGIRDN